MPDLKIPSGMTLDTLLSSYPDEPLPNIRAFSSLAKEGDAFRVRKLMDLFESQAMCSTVIKHHGHDGLSECLRGIAEAASSLKLHMTPRIASVAGFQGYAVY